MVSVLRGYKRKRKARHYLAFLNGEDVTARCQEADTRAGTVILLKRNAEGNFYFDHEREEIAKERLFGRVTVKRKPTRTTAANGPSNGKR